MDKEPEKELFFSFVIPVYNRPDEIRELLESLASQSYGSPFEVVIVEDGSSISSKEVVDSFQKQLDIAYFFKENTGPGDSRNYGMARAKGNYFLILDSDCLLPANYLSEVADALKKGFADCFGGPDTAHASFSPVQKAINYAMTSLLTTGGIRGAEASLGKFQPRSFNMGISKEAFAATDGFGNIHPGEDPDLSIRLWKAGFKTSLIPTAFVYHKRRIDFSKFFAQIKKFGKVRPILNRWHPDTAKITYWFPTVFCLGGIAALLSLFLLPDPWKLIPAGFYVLYFVLVFLDAMFKNRSLSVAFLAIFAVLIQFLAYGYGFLKSVILVNFSGRRPEEVFPELFFNT
ncbi:glycosyltransferase [Poritiphilus flavus]|uniref:Glycosyltransferase n=1 Tax=Poritiphilus flavus TaxID=2697053 RepID=A0A6L9EGK9_9FLAO|nr:glycosyltransferase [Poritiphilus flavus]NAS13389.1 glycosyltransferase [Poritiphilus flavus]